MHREILEFKELAVNASKKVDLSYNAPDIIPYASKMIELVQNNPKLKTEFIETIIGFWDSKEIEHEVIEFCCHALKWNELKEYFTQKFLESKQNKDWRAWQCLSNIVESFDPDWEDAVDFYGEYFCR